MRHHRFGRRLAVGAAALLGATAVLTTGAGLPSASAACATATTRSISGYVAGFDNKDVNVSIGFDVVDGSGRPINVSDGCAKSAGYSAPQQEFNHYVGGEGQARASKMYDVHGTYKGVTARNWSLKNLPSNAAAVWIEVYSRGYKGSECTSCFGPKDVHKYGYIMRRSVKVGSTGVPLKLPMSCSFSGGSMGKIYGKVFNASGAPVTPTRAMAWSVNPDTASFPMGWGSGSFNNGSYEVPALASGQKYVVWVSYNGVTQKKVGIVVNACKVTPLNFKF